MRSASHSGTRPPCSGRSALPDLWAMPCPRRFARRAERSVKRAREPNIDNASAHQSAENVGHAPFSGSQPLKLSVDRRSRRRAPCGSDLALSPSTVSCAGARCGHRLCVRRRLRTPPHQIEQLRSREHPARLFDQTFQQPKIGRTEANFAIAAPNAPGQSIEIEVSRRTVARRPAPAGCVGAARARGPSVRSPKTA